MAEFITAPAPKKKERIFELDFIRGILIIAMIVQHFGYFCARFITRVWDANKLNNYEIWKFGNWCDYFMYSTINDRLMEVAWVLFFFMAGITLTFSRHNYRRACYLLGMFAVLYFLTFLWKNYFNYRYIYILGFGMFLAYALYIFIWTLINKLPVIVHMAICGILLILLVLFMFYFPSPDVNPLKWFGVNRQLNINSTAGFSLFPSVFYFSFGVVIGKLYYENRKSPLKLSGLSNLVPLKPILWAGHHATILYAVQAVLYPVVFFVLTIVINGSLYSVI
jgi:uncharacterized membrane protein